MKREIKFRFWDRANKKMYIQEGDRLDLFFNSLSFPLYWGVLMEFTGLRNAPLEKYPIRQEVFEGDIVRQFEDICVIERCVGGFHCRMITRQNKGSAFTFSFLDTECEVIGNIYQNPELVEGVGNEGD